MTKYYETIGSVRGNCGHHHKTIEAAQRCIDRDMVGCKSQGGYSDRFIHLIEDGQDKGPVNA